MDRSECEILLHQVVHAYNRMHKMILLDIPDPEIYSDTLEFYVKTKNKILDLMTEVRYPER